MLCVASRYTDTPRVAHTYAHASIAEEGRNARGKRDSGLSVLPFRRSGRRRGGARTAVKRTARVASSDGTANPAARINFEFSSPIVVQYTTQVLNLLRVEYSGIGKSGEIWGRRLKPFCCKKNVYVLFLGKYK